MGPEGKPQRTLATLVSSQDTIPDLPSDDSPVYKAKPINITVTQFVNFLKP